MATTYYATKGAAASDSNGGTSLTVRSSGTDGIVNATAGTTKITSATASWSAGDVGHGIKVALVWRVVTAFTAGGPITVTTAGSTAITSSGAFTAAMVGQGLTGTNIAANTVITVVTDASHATISVSASGSGTQSVTLSPMLTCGTGNVVFAAATAIAWAVGGPFQTLASGAFPANSAIQGGDTVYISPGIWRESVTISITNPTGSQVNIIGDVDGSHTGGTSGEVRCTGFLINDFAAPTGGLWNLNAKNFLALSNINFDNPGQAVVSGLGGNHLTFTNCWLIGSTSALLSSNTLIVDTNANVLFDSCGFVGSAASVLTAPTSTIADYNVGWTFQNCLIWQFSGTFIQLAGSGANTFKPGGVSFINCTCMNPAQAVMLGTSTTTTSTTIPCTVYNCVVSALSAGATGAIVEDFNVFTVARLSTNVTAGLHSTNSQTVSTGAFLEYGQSRTFGVSRPAGMVRPTAPFSGWGGITSSPTPPSVDMLGRPRPGNSVQYVTSGTATGGANGTITDTGANFGASGNLAGAVIKIVSGTGSGQVKMIKSHTNTVITGTENWQTNPDNTSGYLIYWGTPATTGKATAGSTTTATVSNAAWGLNQWAGFTLTTTGGTGSGQTITITSNTATVLTFPAITALDSTTTFKLYRQTDENTVNRTVGAIENRDAAKSETVVVDSGTVGWAISGYSDQELCIPVDTTSTTITVRSRWDSTYGGTNKPQIILVADAEIGVTTQTVTGTAVVNTWETLSLGAFTPTAPGVVTVRLQARSDAPGGRAFFDTVTVT